MKIHHKSAPQMRKHTRLVPVAWLLLWPALLFWSNASHAQFSPKLPATVWSRHAGAVEPALQIGPPFTRDVWQEPQLRDLTDADVVRLAQRVSVPENVLGLLFPVHPYKANQPWIYDMGALAVYDGRFSDPAYQELAALSGAAITNDIYARRALLELKLVKGLPKEVMTALLDALMMERLNQVILPVVYAKPFNPFRTQLKEAVVLPVVNKATVFDPYQRNNPGSPVISVITPTFESSGRVLEDRAMNPWVTQLPPATEPAYVGQAAMHPAVRE